MKHFLLIGLLLPLFAIAQNKWTYAPTAGFFIQKSNMYFAGSNQYQNSSPFSIGLFGGANFKYNYSDKLNVQGGAIIHWYGIKNKFSDSLRAFFFTNQFTGFHLPISINYQFRKIAFGIGPSFDLNFFSRQKVDVSQAGSTSTTRNQTNELMQLFLIGMRGVVGYALTPKIELCLSYKWLPKSLFETPNYNNQYFADFHQLGIAVQYWIR